MEFDEFLTGQRWNILEILAKEPSSPVQISEMIQTSTAYVSQQLKLLEAIGIIEKTRTKASSAGQPRILYSLKEDFFFIISLTSGSSLKTKITPTTRQKIILKIWTLENSELAYFTEKLFWRIELNLREISQISIDTRKFKVFIETTNKAVEQDVKKFLKEIDEEIDCEIKSQNPEPSEKIIQIYKEARI